ncbi:MAG: VTT domain-containing protein [Candidatus Tectomicrobia bacterium]|uniref:VTT domain-containing protein n=1 Tax=Tectimicrobiota bacterium TaxID=2528274 RepID=A0A933GME8_UNCTE|nr:VTT domain-containing protein [Candidatus Tectomicrobia bacterium]
MDFVVDILARIYNVEDIIRWGGIAMISAIIFTETGLMLGFFLPGDSLLVSAGIFVAAGHLNLYTLLIIVSLSAVVGDQLGYYIGRKTGQALFTKEDSLLFKRSHILRARLFYERYGGKTIVLARFIPIIRTFAPVVAGVGQMNYRRFVSYNIFGGILWVFAMVLGGYLLGTSVPNINKHIHIVIAIVIFLSIMPGIIELLRSRKKAS